MNILTGFISGEKRQRSESPPPADDPTEAHVFAALQKFGPYLVEQLSEKVGISLKATIEATVAAAVEPLQAEIGQLADRVGTLEGQFTSLGSNIDSVLAAKVDSKVAARVGAVDETVRATFEAMDNNVNQCLLSIDTLERKIRSPNTILFGIEESVGEKALDAVKSLLGAASIKEATRVGQRSPNAKRPRPVLIKFDSPAAKHAAFKKAKELRRQFRVSMDDDLSPMQQAIRSSRLPQAQALRQEGWITFWRGANLFKVKAGGVPTKVPLPGTALPPSSATAAPPTSAPAPPPSSSPAMGPGPSTSSRAGGPSTSSA
jgi:hypothetical protein